LAGEIIPLQLDSKRLLIFVIEGLRELLKLLVTL